MYKREQEMKVRWVCGEGAGTILKDAKQWGLFYLFFFHSTVHNLPIRHRNANGVDRVAFENQIQMKKGK
jgi:hypothetical protein